MPGFTVTRKQLSEPRRLTAKSNPSLNGEGSTRVYTAARRADQFVFFSRCDRSAWYDGSHRPAVVAGGLAVPRDCLRGDWFRFGFAKRCVSPPFPGPLASGWVLYALLTDGE